MVLTFTYKKKYRNSSLWVCFIILLILVGLQDGQTETDYPHYLAFFNGHGYSMYGSVTSPETYNLEWPYYYFCKFLLFFGTDDFIYILGYFIIVALPWLFLVKKESANPPLSLFLLLTLFRSWTFLFFSTVHRQMIATAFVFFAYLLYKSKFKYKYILIAGCLGIAVIGHSSMVLVVPLMLFILLVKLGITKKLYLIILGASVILGIFLTSVLGDVFQNAFGFIAETGAAERTTDYLYSTAEQYQLKEEGSIWQIVPTTLVTLAILLYSSKDELKGYFFNFLFWGTVIYNLFSFVPLSNRIVTTLFLFGIVGAIPAKMQTDTRCRIFMLLAMVVNFYLAYRWYIHPSFRLEYHSILQQI